MLTCSLTTCLWIVGSYLFVAKVFLKHAKCKDPPVLKQGQYRSSHKQTLFYLYHEAKKLLFLLMVEERHSSLRLNWETVCQQVKHLVANFNCKRALKLCLVYVHDCPSWVADVSLAEQGIILVTSDHFSYHVMVKDGRSSLNFLLVRKSTGAT